MAYHRTRAFLLLCFVLFTPFVIEAQQGESQISFEELQRLTNVQRSYDRLLYIPGVEGTAIRLEDDMPSFVIYISRDKDSIPGLPEVFVSRDERPSISARTVRVEKFSALGALMGTSTSNDGGCYAGSLGIAVKQDDSGVLGYVTNAHVAAAEKRRLCPNGKEKRQVAPGRLDVHCENSALIGTLIDAPDIPVDGRTVSTVDAAFVAEIPGAVDPSNACGICPSDLTIITPAYAVTNHIKVRKCGRGSKVATYGAVQEISGRIWVHYRCGIRAIFVDQIVVASISQEPPVPPFAGPGDSGSVAYGETAGVLGLLFAGNGVSTLLNPMEEVQSKLHVKIDADRHCR